MSADDIVKLATPIALIVLAVMQQLQARKANLASTENKAQTNEIHTLVNSNFAIQLKVSAAALRRVADLTKDPADAKIAVEAEQLMQNHVAKQTVVDNMVK